MSGDRLVARHIAELKEDIATKQCLQALFSFELENAELRVVQFSDKYEKDIKKYTKAWSPPDEVDE